MSTSPGVTAVCWRGSGVLASTPTACGYKQINEREGKEGHRGDTIDGCDGVKWENGQHNQRKLLSLPHFLINGNRKRSTYNTQTLPKYCRTLLYAARRSVASGVAGEPVLST